MRTMRESRAMVSGGNDADFAVWLAGERAKESASAAIMNQLKPQPRKCATGFLACNRSRYIPPPVPPTIAEEATSRGTVLPERIEFGEERSNFRVRVSSEIRMRREGEGEASVSREQMEDKWKCRERSICLDTRMDLSALARQLGLYYKPGMRRVCVSTL